MAIFQSLSIQGQIGMQRSGRGMHSRGGKTTIGYETVEKRKYPKILQEYEFPAYQKLRR